LGRASRTQLETLFRRAGPLGQPALAAGETLDALLPEAFAVVREAGKRALACATSTCS
jgi:preprotein translocase subunit SecA